jgi:hypothetical protein
MLTEFLSMKTVTLIVFNVLPHYLQQYPHAGDDVTMLPLGGMARVTRCTLPLLLYLKKEKMKKNA